MAVGTGGDGATYVGADVAVSVGVGPGDIVTVATAVAEGVADGPGTGVEASDCGIGLGCTNQSARLSLLSRVLPLDPPGRRSMLDFAGGAGAAVAST